MKLFTKMYLTLLCLLTAGVMTVNAQEDEIFDFDASFYHSWSEVSATATDNGTAGGGVKLNEEVGEGGTIWGNLGGSVPYLCYANITDYSELRFEGTPGATIRLMCNRLVDEGPIYEIRPTIGQDGKLTVSISDLKYLNGGTACNFVCLQSIKIPWGGSAATITSIKIVKPGDPLSVPKDDLKKAINAGKLVSPVAKTAESFAVLTRAISSAETALVAENATAESLQAAAKAVNDAIDGLALAEGYYNLTKEMYKHWNDNYNPTESSEFNGAYVVGESTGQPYGDGSVYYLNFADISAYDKLILTVADGTPRIMMNRLEVGNGGGDNNGGSYVQLTDAPVNGVVEVDLTAYEYAHLNAIKGANYANVTVTGMYLYKSPAPVLNTYTATFTTNRGWEEVYAYVWSGEGENKLLGDWPGTELTATDGVYTVSIKAAEAPANIIFNNGQGGEGNQTADLVFENGKAYEYNAAAQATEATFDFNASNHAVSASGDVSGDITKDEVNTVNDVVMTISPASSGTPNRYWGTNNGPQLRMYGGTMTLEAPEGKAITKVIINNGKWNNGNTFNGVAAEKGEWEGNSTNIVLAIAGNTQMNSVVVTLADKTAETTTYGTEPTPEPVHIANTAETAYTVAKAIELIDAGEALSETVYVKGIVSRVDDDAFNSKYNSVTYWISADGTTNGQQFECYSGKGLEGADFTSKDDVAVGASVIVKGTLKKFGEVYELNQNNQLVSYEYTAPVLAYTLVGAYNVGGENKYPSNLFWGAPWDETKEENNLVKGDDGIYTIEFKDVEFTELGTIQYKVVKNHSWDTNWGFNGENAEYVITELGTYDVLFKFNPNATFENGYNVDCVVTKQTVEPIYIETDLTAQFSALTDYTKWVGATGYTGTDYCPAVDINDGTKKQVCEKYETTCATTGDVFYQTVTGLTPGTYKIELYGGAAFTFGRGFGSMAFTGEIGTGDAWGTHNSETYTAGQHIDTETGMKLYATTSEGTYEKEIPIYYATNFPDGAATVVLDGVVIGTNGEVKLGLNKTSQSTNWHVVQLKGVTAQVNAVELHANTLAAAKAALNAEENAVVTGEEKTALETAISENTTVAEQTADAYKAAIKALSDATDAFTSAKAAYEGYVAAQAYLVDLPYANAEKKPVAEAATNAADATTKAEALLVALRPYYESAALAENVAGAKVMTDSIKNPKAEDGINNWTVVLGEGSGGNIDVKSNEPWTDAAGVAEHKYFDGGNWGAQAWDVALEQKINLPAGKYQLTTIARASGDVDFTLYAGADSVKIAAIGAVGGVFNRGWNNAAVEFEMAEADSIVIGVRGVTKEVHNWMSFSDFRLVQLEAIQPAETKLYIIGDGTANAWNGTTEMTYKEETQTFECIVESESAIYIAIGDAAFTDWDDFNANHRWAIGTGDQDATVGVATQLQKANGTLKLAAGAYIVSVTKDMQCTITKTVPTGINAIAADRLNGVLYNLNGQKVMKAQKGLYIINGKKVVKK